MRIVMDELSRLDPVNQARYRENSQALLIKLTRQDEDLKSELAGVKGAPYLVFHDAYQYFESHYGLNAIGSVTVSPNQMPGVKRLSELRNKIRNSKVRCIFSEPQFEPKLVEMLIEGSSAKSGVLDPLGSKLSPSTDAYFVLLRNLATSLTRCPVPMINIIGWDELIPADFHLEKLLKDSGVDELADISDDDPARE